MQNPYPSSDVDLARPASKDSPAPPADSLRGVLTRAFGLVGVVPLLLIGLLAGVGDYALRRQQADAALAAAVTAVSADLDLFLGAHRSAVQQVAAEVSETPESEGELVQRLQRTRHTFPALLTMLVTDAEGRVRAGSFDNRTGIDRAVWFGIDVSDRAYFRQPRDTGLPAVQGVFQGRGFGTDALCAVSAPIRGPDGDFQGVVQGSIRLGDLEQAFSAASHTAGMRLLVLDPLQHVAYASPALALEVLAPAPEGLHQPLEGGHARFVETSLKDLGGSDVLALEQTSQLGWRVLALMPRSVLLDRTLLDLGVVGFGILVVGALAFLLGRRLATRLVRPIEEIGKRMDTLVLAPHPERFSRRSELSELASLETAFQRLGQRLAESYGRLQEEFRKESELRAELSQARAESARAEGELDAAREIQMSMLPSTRRLARYADRLQIAAMLEPMRAVGGDFFSIRPVDVHRLAFFVGDVSDKGVPAALFMARTLTLLEYAAERGEAPAESLQRVGRVLARNNASGMFVTVLAGRVDLDTGQVELASAGHDPPIVKPALGPAAQLPMRTGPALGFEADVDFPSHTLDLSPGDALLAFTDGLTEARDPEGRMFGETRLVDALTRSSGGAQERLTAVLTAGEAYRQGAVFDDSTVLLLQRPGPSIELLGCPCREAWVDWLDAVDSTLSAQSIARALRLDARLLLEESVLNAFTHGGATRAWVELRVEPAHVDFALMDDGRAFDPLAQNLPALDLPLEQRAIGGLGVLLMGALAQQLRWRRHGALNLLQFRLMR